MMEEELNVDRKTVTKTATKVMGMREGSVKMVP